MTATKPAPCTQCGRTDRTNNGPLCLKCWVDAHPNMERHLNAEGREVLQRQRAEVRNDR